MSDIKLGPDWLLLDQTKSKRTLAMPAAREIHRRGLWSIFCIWVEENEDAQRQFLAECDKND